jgi:hypothetical protein
MKTTRILAVSTAAILLASCATDYSSASVNDRRGRQLTSYGQLGQNRIQRANEGEESYHQRNLRYNQRDEILHPLKTVNEGAALLRGIGLNL